MTERQLGTAVVGTGFGCLTHVPAFRDAGFEVRVLIGRDPVKTAERAARFGIPYSATSITEALGLTSFDAVSIATPPHTHAALVGEALKAGLHIVCEKPFATDAAEARGMLEAAEKAGVVHLIGTEFRWSAEQILLARTIREGAVGTPKLATWMLHIPVLAGPSAETPQWWGRAEDGGGWLGAHASHWIDQIRHTLGEFASVNASLIRLNDDGRTAEDTFSVHFRLVTGVEGIMQSTAGDWGPIAMTTRVSGTKGTAWIDGDVVWVADADGERRVPVPGDLANPDPEPPPADLLHTAYDMLHCMGIDRAPYAKLARTFKSLILGKPHEGPTPATFRDGLAGQAVLDAIRRSAAEKRSIEVETPTI